MAGSGEQDDSAQYAALEKEIDKPDSDPFVRQFESNYENASAGDEPTPAPARETRQPDPPQYQQQRRAEPQQQRRADPLQQTYDQLDEASRAPLDVDDNPIEYFQAKVGALENHAHNLQIHTQDQAFLTAVKQSEDHFRNELEDPTEYSDACDHAMQHRMQELRNIYPDTNTSLALARQHGFNHQDGRAAIAQMREAVLQQDIAGIAANALRQGMSPAVAYYHAAMTRGFKPRSVMLNTYRRNVMKELSRVSDRDENHPVNKGFDIFWDEYAKTSKQREATAED